MAHPLAAGFLWVMAVNEQSETLPVLAVSALTKTFGNVHAVRDVSFAIMAGKSFGLVGESGSGKSTTARLVLRLIDPTSGTVQIQGSDLSSLDANALRRLRQHMQMIFQDPYGSLNPRMTVREILSEPLEVHDVLPRADRKTRVSDLIQEVGLPLDALERFPHEFSGGQRQRIAIARALATSPQLLIADEPVSALDVSIQAQVLNLLKDLHHRHNLAMLFISHDLRVVHFMCDEIAVMYLGKIVEVGPRDAIFNKPAHPYTRALIESMPGRGLTRARLRGEIPSADDIPAGCPFRSRCREAVDRCAVDDPRLVTLDGRHLAACHLVQVPAKAT